MFIICKNMSVAAVFDELCNNAAEKQFELLGCCNRLVTLVCYNVKREYYTLGLGAYSCYGKVAFGNRLRATPTSLRRRRRL